MYENKLNFHIKSLVPKMFYNFKVSHTFYCGTHIKLFFLLIVGISYPKYEKITLRLNRYP